MINMGDDLKCMLCGGEQCLEVVKVGGLDGKEYWLNKCQNCKMHFIWPRPSDDYLNTFYSVKYAGQVKEGIIEWGNFLKNNRQVIEDSHVKLKYVERYGDISRRGKLLDIGCGHGFFVYAAKMLGYKEMGVDIDKQALTFGQSHLGVNVSEKSLDSIAQMGQKGFDVITAWQVLEHLSNPGNVLSQVNELLKPGGIFAGALPNINGIGFKLRGAKWHLMVPPEHLNFFNKRSLRKLLIQNGFSPVFIGTIPLYASPYFSFGIRVFIMRFARKIPVWFIDDIAQWFYRVGTLIKRYAIYGLLNNLVMALNLGGDNIFFVACKKGGGNVRC